MAVEDAPPELQTALEENVGTPPEIIDPAVDFAKAMQFHLLNNPAWMLTMKVWNENPEQIEQVKVQATTQTPT
jgi:hypothetical protein